MYDESLPIIQNPGSRLAQIGAQGGRIVTEMVSRALALSKANPSLVPGKKKDVPGAIMGEGIRTEPDGIRYDRDFPDAAYTEMVEMVRGFLKEGIMTPEQLGTSLSTRGVAFRAFTEAIWCGMGAASAKIRAIRPDWNAIYSELDKPAATVSSKPPPSTKTASPRTNS